MGTIIVLIVAAVLAVGAYRTARKKGDRKPVTIGLVSFVLAFTIGSVLTHFLASRPGERTQVEVTAVPPAASAQPASPERGNITPSPDAARLLATDLLKLADQSGKDLRVAVGLNDTVWAERQIREIDQAIARFDPEENPAVEEFRPCLMALVEVRDVIHYFFNQMSADSQKLLHAGIERYEAKSNQCEDAITGGSGDADG